MYAHRATGAIRVACPLVQASHALSKQSGCDRTLRQAHPDGWGIVHYQNDRPQPIRSIKPAFDDPLFVQTAESLAAPLVIAHVRQASVGTVNLQNTHPFTHDRWTFAHNGTVYVFAEVQDRIQAEVDPRFLSFRLGTTDSELLFYWFLSRLQSTGVDLQASTTVDRWSSVLASLVRDLIGWCRQIDPQDLSALNLLVTDGQSLAVTRWNRPLSWLTEQGMTNCRQCGQSHAVHPAADDRALLIASEPVDDRPWQELPPGQMLIVRPDATHEQASFLA
jgi:glutamine amidotransferase